MEDIAGKTLYIFKRLREPSTHAALASLFVLAGSQMPNEAWDSVMNGLAILFGIVGVFVAESKPVTKVEGF